MTDKGQTLSVRDLMHVEYCKGSRCRTDDPPSEVVSIACTVLDRRLDRVQEEVDLVGAKEVGIILGVTRQRAADLGRTHPDFPKLLAELASGPVWTRRGVLEFAKIRRKPGRPRKTTEGT